MDVSPASIAQVRQAADGRIVTIDSDVGDIARQLHEIDAGLKLRYSEAGDCYIVYHVTERAGETVEHLVTTAQELDARIVERIQKIARPGYDFLAEIERLDAAADRAFEARQADKIGDASERLVHAFRKDLGAKNRAFLPGERRVA